MLTIFSLSVFSLALLSELLLIFWLPFRLNSEQKGNREVARQEMVHTLDILRSRLGRFKAASRYQGKEVAMMTEGLDNLARYLREYSKQLDIEQIRAVRTVLQQCQKSLSHFTAQKQYAAEISIDTSACLKRTFSGFGPTAATAGKTEPHQK